MNYTKLDTISIEEWKELHKDYKGIINGKHYILKLVSGKGTCLVPVEVIK